ncbi:MAG: FmdB family zinc ribbon protein [Gemmatimonadaceae bacterium]
MPTYEFRCPSGHEFEKLYRTISGAEALAHCPQCGQDAERVMSAAGFAFKGSGFYLTDYGKNAHRDKGTPEPKSGAPSAEGGGDAKKADSKGESTAPAPPTTTNAPAAESKPKSESKPVESKPAPAAPKKSSGE